VGNDIVDLKTTAAIGKSRDSRFVKKVLTPTEQTALLHSAQPDTLLWAFWAAKETGYKAVSKTHPDVSSAPRKYPITLYSGVSMNPRTALLGLVTTPVGFVKIRFFFHEDYVHCIGTTGRDRNSDHMIWCIRTIPSAGEYPKCSTAIQESACARRLAAECIAACIRKDPTNIDIRRHKLHSGFGPPMVYYKGEKENMNISLSHDGRFIACAVVFPKEVQIKFPNLILVQSSQWKKITGA